MHILENSILRTHFWSRRRVQLLVFLLSAWGLSIRIYYMYKCFKSLYTGPNDQNMFLLLSKAPFISEQFIYFWWALSNQTVPCQALTKYNKRQTTKVSRKWKWFRWSPSSHPQKFVFPSTRPSWSLPLSLAINCQCLQLYLYLVVSVFGCICTTFRETVL